MWWAMYCSWLLWRGAVSLGAYTKVPITAASDPLMGLRGRKERRVKIEKDRAEMITHKGKNEMPGLTGRKGEGKEREGWGRDKHDLQINVKRVNKTRKRIMVRFFSVKVTAVLTHSGD